MKYLDTAEALKTRIVRGDYLLKKLPVEHELMKEFGISRVTVRKAIQALIDQGVVRRRANMSIEIADTEKLRERYLAFLRPAFPNSGMQVDQARLERVVRNHGMELKVIDYVDWDDPVIRESFQTFPGIFFYGLPTPLPPNFIRELAATEAPVIGIHCDLSPWGRPSFFSRGPGELTRILNYLDSQGHAAIWCLNTQPEEPLILDYLKEWRAWCGNAACDCRLLNEPVEPYGLNWVRAYEVMARLLEAGEFSASALLCTTLATAVGAGRALHEHGFEAGRDVALCSAGDDGLARFLCPSVTCHLDPPDAEDFLSECVEWIVRGGRDWRGPLLFRSACDNLFIGESTSQFKHRKTGERVRK